MNGDLEQLGERIAELYTGSEAPHAGIVARGIRRAHHHSLSGAGGHHDALEADSVARANPCSAP